MSEGRKGKEVTTSFSPFQTKAKITTSVKSKGETHKRSQLNVGGDSGFDFNSMMRKSAHVPSQLRSYQAPMTQKNKEQRLSMQIRSDESVSKSPTQRSSRPKAKKLAKSISHTLFPTVQAKTKTHKAGESESLQTASNFLKTVVSTKKKVLSRNYGANLQ